MLRGWSQRAVLWCELVRAEQEWPGPLLQDCFQALGVSVSNGPGSRHVKKLHMRSTFHLQPVVQLVLASQHQEDVPIQPSPALNVFLNVKFARFIQELTCVSVVTSLNSDEFVTAYA